MSDHFHCFACILAMTKRTAELLIPNHTRGLWYPVWMYSKVEMEKPPTFMCLIPSHSFVFGNRCLHNARKNNTQMRVTFTGNPSQGCPFKLGGLVQRTSTHFRPFLTPPPCPLSIYFRLTPLLKDVQLLKTPGKKRVSNEFSSMYYYVRICLISQGIFVFFSFFSMTFWQLQYHTKAKNFMPLLSVVWI